MSLQAASLAQLEAACPGASQDFILGQLKSQQSVEAAATAYAAGLLQELNAAKGQITALQSTIASMKHEGPSARERELQSQLDLARKSTGNHAPLREKPAGYSASAYRGSSTGGVADQVREMVAELTAGGMDRQKAHAKVMRENPQLREQLVEEANAALA